VNFQFHVGILWQKRHSDFVHISTHSNFGYSDREKDFIPGSALLRTTNRPCAAQNSLCQSVVYSSANST
jgi:CHAT domain-containing protein